MTAALASLIDLALALNAPPCHSDLWHFPPLAVVDQRIAELTEHLQCLEWCAWYFPHHVVEFRQAITDVQRELVVWELLRQCWLAAPPQKPAALERLRCAVGWGAYYAGLR